MPKLFISYSRVDTDFLETLYPFLGRKYQHENIWYDDWLHGGDDWWNTILKQIEWCDIFIYLLSNESVTSLYCKAEFAEAQRLQKHIITIQIRDRTKLDETLGSIHYIDMKPGIDKADAYTRLYTALDRYQAPNRKSRPLWKEKTQKPNSVSDPIPNSRKDMDTPSLHSARPKNKQKSRKSDFRWAIIVGTITIVAMGTFAIICTIITLNSLNYRLSQNDLRLTFQAELAQTQTSIAQLSQNIVWTQQFVAGTATHIAQLSLTPLASITPIPANILMPPSDTSLPSVQGNNLIVFTGDRNSNREIYTMRPDGSELTALTNNSTQDFDPQWSPDGQSIVFVSARDSKTNIYLMSANGNNVRRLSDNPNAFHDNPIWSPDGQYIAYVSDATRENDVYIMKSDGSNERNLTNSEERELDPAWSPDGYQIAFLREVEGTAKIFLMNNNGTNVRRLVEDEEDEYDFFHSPSWSPDGKELAYAVEFYFSDGSTSITEINIFNLATHQSRLVTSYNESYIESISWSPDGKFLVYQFQQGSSRDMRLNVIAIDGSSVRQIDTGDLNALYPSWATFSTTNNVVIDI